MISTLINLISPKIGSYGVYANDEFFAPLERMLSEADPIFIPDKYDNHGKWMDGWETRRRRTPGYDWCLIKLGCPGTIKKIEINTKFFTGNYPPHAEIEGIYSEKQPDEKDKNWKTILHKTSIKGDAVNNFNAENENIINWVKLKIFPDGGVARLRLWGNVFVDWDKISKKQILELSALKNGGKIISYNNAHYGDISAILSHGRGKNMGDGWETRRRREPGNDWLIIKLGKKGYLTKAEVDTAFFKGNYPESCSIQAIDTDDISKIKNENWVTIIPKSILNADKVHKFSIDTKFHNIEFSHVKLNIFPDGGVSRLRIFGHI